MSSSISILGMGYVGSVSAACFAHMGHQVTGVDINPSKVEMLESGRSPIVESRMTELVAEGHASGRLHATTDVSAAILESDISFICVSNAEHLDRTTEMVLRAEKTRIAMLGLSFKAATDDLRESPHVRMVKRLLGEGRQIRIWDENVSLGRLIWSNLQYIEEVIPHLGSLLCSSLDEALENSGVIVIGTREVDPIALWQNLKPGQTVIDLVNLQKCRRPSLNETYEGICWEGKRENSVGKAGKAFAA